MRTRQSRLDDDIFDVLKLAAENSAEDHTIWIDVDAITFVVMEHFTRGSRHLVKKRLMEMRRCGVVESRNFGAYTGWKLASDKCCQD